MDDQHLIAAVARGDHTALRTIFERHAPWLSGRLRSMLPAHAVEDVLQETFVAVWRGANRYSSGGEVGAWLWGIARRQAAMWARKNRRHDLVQGIEHFAPGPSDPADDAATRVDIGVAMEALGPDGSPQRRLAQLAFVEDRPVRDIAEKFNIPAGTVKSRVYTLRRRLQAMLGGDK